MNSNPNSTSIAYYLNFMVYSISLRIHWEILTFSWFSCVLKNLQKSMSPSFKLTVSHWTSKDLFFVSICVYWWPVWMTSTLHNLIDRDFHWISSSSCQSFITHFDIKLFKDTFEVTLSPTVSIKVAKSFFLNLMLLKSEFHIIIDPICKKMTL